MATEQTKKKRYVYSTPSLDSVLQVGSEHAKGIVVRIPGRTTAPPFAGVIPALFAIDVVTRQLGKTNRAFDHKAVSAAVDAKLQSIEDDFNAEIARLEAFIKSEGITARASYNSPVDFSFEVTTPQIQRAAALVTKLDQLVMLVDTLWLTGRLNQDEAESYKNMKAKVLTKGFRSLISTGFSARKKAFDKNTPEALEAQKAIIEAEEKSADESADGADQVGAGATGESKNAAA
ncbi:MAG: DUF1845 family protein [Halopseudomonas aestusnigri]|nr:DUF1845 family protein [Halopseudomonas aestusnigri]